MCSNSNCESLFEGISNLQPSRPQMFWKLAFLRCEALFCRVFGSGTCPAARWLAESCCRIWLMSFCFQFRTCLGFTVTYFTNVLNIPLCNAYETLVHTRWAIFYQLLFNNLLYRSIINNFMHSFSIIRKTATSWRTILDALREFPLPKLTGACDCVESNSRIIFILLLACNRDRGWTASQ